MMLTNVNKNSGKISTKEFMELLKKYFKKNNVISCYIRKDITEQNDKILYVVMEYDSDIRDFMEMRNFLNENGYILNIFKRELDIFRQERIVNLYSVTTGMNEAAVIYLDKKGHNLSTEKRNENIEWRVASAKKSLYDLRKDATRLLSNIDSALEHIDEIKTEEDMYDFIENHEIEDGLEYIDI